MKNKKYRVKKLNRRISILLIVALVISGINITGITGSYKVFAEESGGEKETTEQSIVEPEMTREAFEEETAEEPTPEEPTTEEPTSEQQTTPPPTTTPQEPTTPAITIKVEPWGKNSSGQFVNGKKEVMKGATMKGIDVSYHNGSIDWKKVAASDVDYAIIRCGYGDNKKSQDDKKWKANVAGCEKYNIPYGVYIYSYAKTTKQAKSEAQHVLRLIKGHTLSFPIYYDMEDKSQEKLSKKTKEKIANTFLDAIRAEGYECSLYANLNWWNNYLPASLANKTTWKWVAQYNNKACTYKGNYQMWQCTDSGKVSGIKGDVDLNFWFAPVRNYKYNIRVTPPKEVTLKSVKKGKKKVTIKWKKVSGAIGYKIQYSTDKKFASKYTKSKKTKNTSITIKKLKSKKRYYFRVKAYKKDHSKKKLYSKKWSSVKHRKIK